MKTNTSIRLLLVEPSAKIGLSVKARLLKNGYHVDLVSDRASALNLFAPRVHNFVVVDEEPSATGQFLLIRRLRAKNPFVPIMLITSRLEGKFKLQPFVDGADDCMMKPVSEEEMIARIKAIWRRIQCRYSDNFSGVFKLGSINFHYHKQLLISPIKKQTLSKKETDLLYLLCMRKNEIVNREDILVGIWKETSYYSARSMDVYISRIRKKLEIDPQIRIVNAHGVGFRLTTDTYKDRHETGYDIDFC